MNTRHERDLADAIGYASNLGRANTYTPGDVRAMMLALYTDHAALLAHCERLEAALSALVRWLDAAGMSHTPAGGVGAFHYDGTEYDVVTIARAALAAKVTP